MVAAGNGREELPIRTLGSDRFPKGHGPNFGETGITKKSCISETGPSGSGVMSQSATDEASEWHFNEQHAYRHPLQPKPSDGQLSVLLAGNSAGLRNVGEQTWVEFPEPLVIDSGAAETGLPTHWFMDHELKESPGSRSGQHDLAANGDAIFNDGEKVLVLADKDGDNLRHTKFQVCESNTALGSVMKIVKHGNRVVRKRSLLLRVLMVNQRAATKPPHTKREPASTAGRPRIATHVSCFVSNNTLQHYT